ncbi:hypothetical protein OG259_25090 [Streptomyces sp. NBC_00250]|uniref:hypothetical protein n=1 Tax=Streptomyces sp. NBC_00250 TaxID=2903641 RepID=UPI002E2AF4EC|nr:hypothetical protein [Streptomyces sp. NBC_00250]
MTTRLRTYLLTGAALGLLGVGGVGCTDQAPAPAATSATSPATSAPTQRGTAAAAQEKRVKAALDTVSPDDPAFVASGTERVEDGVSLRTPLKKGAAYQLALVCSGEGAVVPTLGGEEIRAVPCDGVPVTHRIAGAPAVLSLTVPGRPGAAGAVGWRIVAVTS